MNIPQYLSRIEYQDEVGVNIETLHGLQLAHMKTVPFENLDISLGRKIQLDEQALWNKVIINKRGGFCYELNGLFASLLKEIGYEVTYLNARDYHEDNDTFGIDFDHLTLMARIGQESTRWLVDVGWGDTFTQPLNIDYKNWQEQGLRAYKIGPFRDGFQLWQRGFDGKIERQYYFDLTAHSFPFEYEATCHYHQTSPESIFTKKRIISRLTDDGRISLDDEKLIITQKGKRSETPVSENERSSLLKEHFGVNLELDG
jgi:N-hydroxyarylamine O-acetyltransferase